MGSSVTIESVPPDQCRSLIGIDLYPSCWVGICRGQLRMLLHGTSSTRRAGDMPPTEWTHVAVT